MLKELTNLIAFIAKHFPEQVVGAELDVLATEWIFILNPLLPPSLVLP